MKYEHKARGFCSAHSFGTGVRVLFLIHCAKNMVYPPREIYEVFHRVHNKWIADELTLDIML
jgi:hypothetical protein